jgi:hypothetical protein
VYRLFVLSRLTLRHGLNLVNIESKEPLKGIYIQGRKPNGTEPIGTFLNLPEDTHIVECPTVRIKHCMDVPYDLSLFLQGDGITHSSRQQWKNLTLTWKKPSTVKSEETIQFW